jgi:hypothetical protein
MTMPETLQSRGPESDRLSQTLIMPQLYSLDCVRQSQCGGKTILFLVNTCTPPARGEHLYTIQAQKNPPPNRGAGKLFFYFFD